jgi:hypothetical protein
MPLIVTIVAVFLLWLFAALVELKAWRSLGRLIRSWRRSA